MDAANLERAGVATVVLGLPQLLATIGQATAEAQQLSTVGFIAVPGNLHHALDYVPDESDFWAECVDELLPQVAGKLTQKAADR